jgi:hypothetical protein
MDSLTAKTPGVFRESVGRIKRIKNRLVPDAEISATEMVLREEFAGRAEAAYLFHRLG